MKIELDEQHRYTQDGHPAPGVSEILRTVGVVGDFAWDFGFGRERGSAVHLACQLDDEDDLDEAALDRRVLPYLEGWRRFREDYAPVFLVIEERMGSPLGFCGTPDRVLATPKTDALVVLDIKSGGWPWWGSFQLGGYEQLVRDAGTFTAWDRIETWGLVLPGNGTYRPPVMETGGRQKFLSCLSIASHIYQANGGYHGYRDKRGGRLDDARYDLAQARGERYDDIGPKSCGD